MRSRTKGKNMTKAEKNYKRDYGHKDSAELALNYTRDGMREELDKALSEVSPNDLTADEQEYLDGRNQCRNHMFRESKSDKLLRKQRRTSLFVMLSTVAT
jgi:hypothetical protein